MAVTLTDHRTIINEADNATTPNTWTGNTSLFTSDPDPVESTGCLGQAVSTTTADGYVTVTAVNMTDRLLYVWVLLNGTMDSLANGGCGIYVGDATPDAMSYHKAGSDAAGFRHGTGPVNWQCLVLDQASLPTQKTTRAGSEANLNWTAITRFGATFKTLSKALGGAANCFIDIIRYLDLSTNDGCAISVIGGTSGDPGTWAQIAAADRSTANQAAHGIVRELGTGVFGVQGPLRFGNASGTSSSWFEDTNVSVVFESRGLRTTVYRIYLTDNGTGTTTFKLGTKVGSGTTATGSNGCSLVVPSGVGGLWDSGSDTDVTDVFVYDTLFSGWTGGVKLGGSQEFIDCTFSGCAAVEVAGLATLVNTSVAGSTVAANASSLIWNLATDPDGYLDNMAFTIGGNAHHAIEFGTSSPTTMTLRGIDFTGFNASDTQNDSTFHFRRTTGSVTLNLVGCTGNASYRSDGATITIVQNPVTTTVTVRDISTGSVIENARVYMIADSGGPLTAGTVIINALTNSSGQASDTRTLASDQPVTGWVRKATTSPLYQQGAIAGSIDSDSGLNLTVQLVPDE
jgi:hypothetical protein